MIVDNKPKLIITLEGDEVKYFKEMVKDVHERETAIGFTAKYSDQSLRLIKDLNKKINE